MATKKVTKKAKKKVRKPKADGADSPIIVGGGGGGIGKLGEPYVDLAFNHNDYVIISGNTYTKDDAVLDWLEIDGAPQDGVDQNSRIVISCLNPNPGGGTARITIIGRPLSVSFNSQDFPYDQESNKHTSKKSTKPRNVKKVVADGEQLYPPGGIYPEIVAHSR